MRTPIRSGRRTTPDAGSRAAGFTLMEVILTVLIMSGLLMTMVQLLSAARTTRDTIHNIQENQLAGPAILDLIERDLRGLLVYNRPQGQILRIRSRSLAGLEADSIDFVTSVNLSLIHI